MLSPKPPIPSPALLPNSPTPASWPWHSPVLGHMIFTRLRASPPIDGWLGHPLLHMQLETQLWGLLISSYCCSTYRVADSPSSLGTSSNSSIGGPVIHPIADCEHQLLCLLGPGIVSQEKGLPSNARRDSCLWTNSNNWVKYCWASLNRTDGIEGLLSLNLLKSTNQSNKNILSNILEWFFHGLKM